MSHERYRLSFTTGGLFLQEAPIVAERYLALRDWGRVRDTVRASNLLQVRTAAAALRISKEIVARLEHLDESELTDLLDASIRDRAYLLWTAACRRYAILHDFAVEVLREHYLSGHGQLTPGDYGVFHSAKAIWHVELDEIAPSTRLKLRQNLFRMLREAKLISDQHQIQPAMLSPALAQRLARHGREALMIFPATDNQIQRWLQ